MATYIALLNWTDQGARDPKQSPQRARQAEQLAEKMGAKLTTLYWTMGEYDLVGVVEAPDDETVSRFVLAAGAQGAIRSRTLRAYSREEFERIVGGLG